MKFSKQEVLRAEATWKIQHVAGHLGYSQLIKIAQKSQLKNSPITPRDVRMMQTILGPGIPGLKEKW